MPRCSSVHGNQMETGTDLEIYMEVYKGGLRNPSAGQIHQITAHLSSFGKLQGKNVFYWFQNHKARDKQRLKKKKLLMVKQHPQSCCYYASLSSQMPATRQGSVTVDAAALIIGL
uniref:Homeobox domain-containing protein n=1 Tax=Kalanchoe fedtschenkoi TaxID=63787 RepID=A0A7N0UM54_KALFE